MHEWLAAKHILAVRLDNIGDVIMLGPALRAVKETSPYTRLTLLASPGGATAVPLLPWVDDVITWRTVWQDVGGRIPFDPARERELIDLLAERKFEAALIFTSFSQTPHTPGYACYLAGIPLRAGESKEFGGSTLTTELRGAADELHQTEETCAWSSTWALLPGSGDSRSSSLTRPARLYLRCWSVQGLIPRRHSFSCTRVQVHVPVAIPLNVSASWRATSPGAFCPYW